MTLANLVRSCANSTAVFKGTGFPGHVPIVYPVKRLVVIQLEGIERVSKASRLLVEI
jgi:hypothetical protein